MAGKRPTILVVDDDRDESVVIASVLREAGFAVAAATESRGASAAMKRERFAASVIAVGEDVGVEFLRDARRRQPGLKALIVIGPAATRFVDEEDCTLLTRPFDPRRLLDCVFKLVLHDDEDGTAPHHNHAAEFGIVAATLACLVSRRTAAAAAGARRLEHDLTRQIGHAMKMHRGLAAAMTSGGPAVIG
jgi:DNA-binding NtrC family response regulator